MAESWVVSPGDAVDPASVGGKAWALCRLWSSGVPVPPFVVVTTAAFRRAHQDLDEALVRCLEQAALALVGEGGRLVVRSSATIEDQPGASYAGQFCSVLNVEVPLGVMPAVQRVWASLWSPAAQRYRECQGYSANPAMAVVLMAQVDAHRSGVAFTRDPGGDERCLRIESVEGTADRLVSGAITPDVTLVHRDQLRADDPVMAEVARWALRCEQIFGRPQDIEWVWDGERVLVVQSRPITALTADDDNDDVTTAGIGEMLPGELPASTAELAVTAVDHALVSLLHHLGALPASLPAQGGLVVRRSTHAVLRLDLLAQAAERLPSTTPGRLRDQLTGRVTRVDADAPRASWWRHLAHDLRVVTVRRRTRAQAAVVLAAIDELADGLLDRAAPQQYRPRLVDLFLRTMELEVATAALAAASFERLVSFLTAYVGDDAPSCAARLTQGGVHSPVVERWTEVAERWRSDPVGREALTMASWSHARACVQDAGEVGRDLLIDLATVARRAGSRSVPTGPTWDVDMDAVWAAVRAAATVAPARRGRTTMPGDAALIERLTATSRWRRRRLMTGWLIDSQTVSLRRHVRETSRLLHDREALKDAVMFVGGEVARYTPVRPAPEEPAAHQMVLAGWPASGGHYEGVARVVGQADDPFEPGEILVARTTDPSWSPLFMSAGALVVEQGGLLSHAAVIARELGLPAVVNVGHALEHLRTGMRLRVDGTGGRVTVVGGLPGGVDH